MKIQRNQFAGITAVALALFVVLAAGMGDAIAKKPKVEYMERFSGRAFTLGVDTAQTTVSFNIGIERWSTEDERRALATALGEGGNAALSKLLSETPEIGFVSASNGRQGIKYAREIETADGGRRIIIATDRPLRYTEVHYSLRTEDFSTSVADFTLNEKGKGEGTIAIAAEVVWDRETNTVAVKQNAAQPGRITVRSNKKKK